MPTRGLFEESDLRSRAARGRAIVWVAFCAVLVVGCVASALAEHRWYLWTNALVLVVLGARTGRRLLAYRKELGRDEPQDRQGGAGRHQPGT